MTEQQIATGEAFIRRGATIAKVTDQYGDERIIYRQKGMKDYRLKNRTTTKSLSYNRTVSTMIAENIKKLRLEQGLSYEQLGIKAGISGTPKQRIYEIEKNTRKDGIRMGTLYCIAEALGVEVTALLPDVYDVQQFSNGEE